MFNTDILQTFRLEEVNPRKQKGARVTFTHKLKTATNVHANPGLSQSAFKQLDPGPTQT